MNPARDRGQVAIGFLSLGCFAVWTWTSYARWAGFAYRTFDLAYYVQALWQLIHGRFAVSVEGVPLLGNHVEPIVFLAAPFFFFIRHPMVLVALQNAALASMGPVAFQIGRRLGFDATKAFLLAAALLLTPASGYIALHEFHPEALTAPFLLLMLQAWLAGARRQHWLWFLATLACKENMALLLVAYCSVQIFAERRRGFAFVRGWFVWPMLVAAFWFLLCALVITPAFNSGNIDYASLYSRLGNSGGQIALNAFVRPQLFLHALATSLRAGNLLWALLLPLLFLPILRPRWLLVCVPILLQHMLSWRSSEWTIYFHYAAPLLPFFWFATAQTLTPENGWPRFSQTAQRSIVYLLLLASVIAQFVIGPIDGIAASTHEWLTGKFDRDRKSKLLATIPANASVVAPFPCLSHLAMRQELYSLHYILKGLKTLSRAPFAPPPPTDFVLIDYADTATFDAGAGFYHPTMKTVDGRIVPSSDQLLHDFLQRTFWRSHSVNELTLLRRDDVATLPPESGDSAAPIATMDAHTQLLAIEKSGDNLSPRDALQIKTRWRFEEGRAVYPWLELRLLRPGQSPITIVRGLCAPEVKAGLHEEVWQVIWTPDLPAGNYSVEACFFDNPRRAWTKKSPANETSPASLARPMSLGHLMIESGSQLSSYRSLTNEGAHHSHPATAEAMAGE